jgi:DNA adenine methylase
MIISKKDLDKNKMEMNNISPLRYPGGKTRACKILDKIMIENFNIKEFQNIISPFFGGGSFEFYLQNKYGFNIIANDKFQPLYNFWYICKTNNLELCKKLYEKINNIDKDNFNDYRNTIISEQNTLTQSIKYFIINRCSFSGATLSGGFSSDSSKNRFTKSSIDRIKQLNLDKFEIENLDFEEFIHKYNHPNNLLFLKRF